VTRFDSIDIGNPHVVCQLYDPAQIDLGVAGPAIEAFFADGANVHFVAPNGPDELLMRVWERGAGITLACGTGATASAEVFRRWGVVGDNVHVRMPGGDARVGLGGSVTLTGAATFVASIEVPIEGING